MMKERVRVYEEERPVEENGRDSGMVPMARRVERHYTRPLPGAADVAYLVFPPQLWRGLLWGALAGIVLGVVFGYLLRQGVIAPPGWEGLFSLGPFTFQVFWAMMGAAAGGAIGGVAAILTAPGPADHVGYEDVEEVPQ